jgi:hypothetical protein
MKITEMNTDILPVHCANLNQAKVFIKDLASRGFCFDDKSKLFTYKGRTALLYPNQEKDCQRILMDMYS